MEHSPAAVIDQRIFCGFLEMETKANSGIFHRRFLRLNPVASTLEYFADRQQVACSRYWQFNIFYFLFCCTLLGLKWFWIFCIKVGYINYGILLLIILNRHF